MCTFDPAGTYSISGDTFLICSMSFKMTSPHGFRRMGNWRWFPGWPKPKCSRTLMREVWGQSHTAYLTNQSFTKNSNCEKKTLVAKTHRSMY